MYLQKAIFKNVAPFGDLDLTFDKNQVIILSGINGRGKTTVLSYIADAFFEIARAAGFQDIMEDKTKYYRVTSSSTITANASYSLIYFRFIYNDKSFEYIEIVGNIEQSEYDNIVILTDKINFQDFNTALKEMGYHKYAKIDAKTARKIFTNNILTYFPELSSNFVYGQQFSSGGDPYCLFICS